MMYKINDVNEQLRLFSKESEWSPYKKKLIDNSWYGYFHDYIFPKINEESFRVLYSENNASRPNDPVNVIISLMIIKSLLNITDEEVFQALLFDERIQYVVHMLDEEEIRFSKNIIGMFRSKLRQYEKKTGINLYEKALKELNDSILELHNVDSSIVRRDSMMISDACKNLNRIELAYTVNYNLIKLLAKLGIEIPEEYKCYLNEKHKNDVIYRTRDSETEDKLTTLLTTSLKLIELYKDNEQVNNSDQYQMLVRMVNDQYDSIKKKPKENKEISTTSLQTPVDPNSTYRYKYKSNKGYVADIEEAINEGSPMITNWSVHQNIKSDAKIMKEHLESLEDITVNKNETNENGKSVIKESLVEKSEKSIIKGEKNSTVHPNNSECNFSKPCSRKLKDNDSIEKNSNTETTEESNVQEKDSTVQNLENSSVENSIDGKVTTGVFSSNVENSFNVPCSKETNGSNPVEKDNEPQAIVETSTQTKDDKVDTEQTEDSLVEKSEKQIVENFKKKLSEENFISAEIVDGAYYSEELKVLAEQKGVKLHPTELVGKSSDYGNLLDFKIDDNNRQILECPNGVAPLSSKFNESNNTYTAKFDKAKCEGCPLRDKCPTRECVKTNTLRVSVERLNNARTREERNNSEYQEISNLRAGVEGLPSLLRRRYEIDTRAVKGEVCLKIDLSSSMLAINIKRGAKMMRNSIDSSIVSTKNFIFPKIWMKISRA